MFSTHLFWVTTVDALKIHLLYSLILNYYSQASVREKFDAEKWSNSIVDAFGGKGSAPKGQDRRQSFNFRCHKTAKDDTESMEQKALSLATQFAKSRL